MTVPTEQQNAAIALNRLGLGARPDEPFPEDPKSWVQSHFDRYRARTAAWAGEPTGASLVIGFVEYQRELRQATAANEQSIRRNLREHTLDRYRSAVTARVNAALDTPAPFVERLVHFWANHYAVSTDKTPVGQLAGAFEFEAIRPHVLGRFEDMLVAVERHPAMLLYLDQVRSIGPDSMAANRLARIDPDRRRGLNENLAREILELHTLGVNGGYVQDDVVELARALTGWSLAGLPGLPTRGVTSAPGEFAFYPTLHEPGPRTVLGRRYEPLGESQARSILHDLAVAPATARHVATKLARHLVDDAPAALVDRVADAFVRTGGDLPSTYRALLDSPEVWTLAGGKFRTPWDWALSSLRGLGVRNVRGQQLAPMLTQLGQPVWRPGSPAGYDDVAGGWVAPDTLMRRVEIAQRLAARADSTVDARALGPRLLPAGLSENTATTISRAETPAIALALLLVSPEFLRR